jgi:heme O synthase-like polyprenyltransferase
MWKNNTFLGGVFAVMGCYAVLIGYIAAKPEILHNASVI